MQTQDPQADLAELHRTRRAALQRWDDLAAGRCTLAEAQQAARDAGQSEADVAVASQLFAPMDDAMEAGVIAAIDRAAPPSVRVVQPEVARWRRPALAGGLALLAAGMVLWISPRGDSTRATIAPAAMVEYELAISGVATVRGDADAAPPSVVAGSTLQFTLRPATQHAIVPTVWACASRDGLSIPLTVTPAPSRPGTTIEVSATLPSAVASGTWELVTFVASTARPTQGADACSTAAADHVKVSRRSFVVR